MKPYWLPDWRNPSQYPTNLTTKAWCWQFLRRNENYQNDWDHYYPQSFKKYMDIFKSKPLPRGLKSWEDHVSRFAEMPDCREKYGVSYLLNPAENEVPIDLFVHSTYGFAVNYASEQRFEEYEKNHIKLVAFDLAKSVKPQLDMAKKYLSVTQTELIGELKEHRDHKRKWSLYLRVLDARVSGETFESIGIYILSEKTNGRDPDVSVEAYDQQLNKEENAKARAKQYWDAAREVMFNQMP